MIKFNNSLISAQKIDISQIPVVSDDGLNLDFETKKEIFYRLLEAHRLAKANVEVGNITNRGFATYVCTNADKWSLGTNFNNSRNDISSVCGERSAILSAYNHALVSYMKNPQNGFDFKIKYLCMSSNIDINEYYDFIVPCEDCLSWLNTNRCFDENTLIFSFVRKSDGILKISATKLADLLPYKTVITSNNYFENKPVNYTEKAKKSAVEQKIDALIIKKMLSKTHELYKTQNLANISGQNIAASILFDDEILTLNKIDWTKRWFVEPLEHVCAKAIQKTNGKLFIKAICYFGDEYNNSDIKDGVVSIKTLGRIRQKHATSDTLLILNLNNEILVTTVGEYLPKKFVQGYKI